MNDSTRIPQHDLDAVRPARAGDDAGEAEVAAKVAAAEDRGYLGSVPDDTPNEAYSVAGVTSSNEAARAEDEAAGIPEQGDEGGEGGEGTAAPQSDATSRNEGTPWGGGYGQGQSNTGGQ